MDQKIYLVLSHSGTRISKFFSVTTNFVYSHVSISLDREMTQLYSFGRRNMYIPFISGLVRECINEGVYRVHQNTPCLVFEMVVTQDEYIKLQEVMIDFLSECKEYKYNIMGLPLLYLKIPYKRKKHFTCSQFVACVLDKAEILEMDKDYSVYRPEDFYEIPEKNLIYSGVLQEYCVS